MICPDTDPAVVTCKMITCKFSSGNPFAAVFKMYHDEPVNVVLVKFVAPGVKKNGVIV